MVKKFDLIDFGEDRTKDIAEIMSNDTCKKILDLLKEKGLTETEISSKLNIPLSTIHYNLQKLARVELVRAKSFHWSPKGNKVFIYELSNKLFVFPQKKSIYFENKLKIIFPVIIIASLAVILTVFFLYQQNSNDNPIKKFNSLAEIKDFIKENSGGNIGIFYPTGQIGVGVAMAAGSSLNSLSSGTSTASGTEKGEVDFSKTNVQVKEVDEADIVKNDGKYVYTLTGNKITVVNAYPPENMEILSEIELEGVNNIFINGNKLIAFAQNSGKSVVFIYNLDDRKNPILEKNISLDGNYIDSRMIGNYVYVISIKQVDVNNISPPVYQINDINKEISPGEIYYFDFPYENYVFTSITAIDVQGSGFESKVYLTGATQNIYVSLDNIYLTNTKRMSGKVLFEKMVEEVFLPLLPSSEKSRIEDVMNSEKSPQEKMANIGEIVENYSSSLQGDEKANFDLNLMKNLENFSAGIEKEMEKTFIYKINFDKLNIQYKTQGQVNGNVLNQFSMDEYNGNFRIATTTGRWGGQNLNHIYVLNGKLEVIGSVEDLAKGEKIYSARFLEDRGYLVTFRQVDPLFVVDLSVPEHPKVLGELKIPGYSDYLHPYDKDHLIGIGKEANENGLFQGVKLSLFDVSDVNNPKELHNVVIGERGTDSEVLRDHKALLFDKEKGILVLPISLVSQSSNLQGAYVYNLTLDNGFQLKGIITHGESIINESDYIKSGPSIKRSFYINNALYTVSARKIMVNSLDTLNKINELEIGWIPLYTCGTLNVEEGAYRLQNDINTSGTCFVIGGNNIVLDLNGHSITGDGNGQGVNIEGYSGAVIKNGEISNFAEGIKIMHSSGNIIINTTLKENMHQGVYMFQSTGNAIFQNHILSNCHVYGFGEIELDGSDNNLIQDNHIEKGSKDGIHVFSSNNNILADNHLQDNSNLGIDVNMAFNNIVKDNLVERSIYGIHLGGTKDIQSKSNQIINNTLLQNSLGGIELSGETSQFNTLIGNIIEN